MASGNHFHLHEKSCEMCKGRVVHISDYKNPEDCAGCLSDRVWLCNTCLNKQIRPKDFHRIRRISVYRRKGKVVVAVHKTKEVPGNINLLPSTN